VQFRRQAGHQYDTGDAQSEEHCGACLLDCCAIAGRTDNRLVLCLTHGRRTNCCRKINGLRLNS
jgi:hypothetical protein